jgi:hypothetical protein
MNAEIPCLSAPNYVYTLARDVVQAVCTRMHLETGRFELVSAMVHCLGLTDAADTFARGVTIFGDTGLAGRGRARKNERAEAGSHECLCPDPADGYARCLWKFR